MVKKNRALAIQKAVMYTLFFLTFGIMMCIGTTRDLEISKLMFNYQNTFARFMESYSMLPVSSIQLLAFSLLFTAYHKVDDALDIAQSFLPFISRIRDINVIRKIVFIIHHIIYALFLYGAFQGSNEFLNFIFSASGRGNLQDILVDKGAPKVIAIIVWTVARVALLALVLILMRKIDKKHLKAFEFMAIAGLFLYHASDVINLLKGHFHRVRFREMVAYSHALIDQNGVTSRGDADMPKEWVKTSFFTAYTPWYKPGNDYGVYSNSDSFPSGHTAAAAFSMLLPMLASKAKKATKLFVPAFLLGFGYTLATGFSRIIIGAHYLTDISADAIIMFAMLIVIMGIMNAFERHSDKKLRIIARKRIREEEKAKLLSDSKEEKR